MSYPAEDHARSTPGYGAASRSHVAGDGSGVGSIGDGLRLVAFSIAGEWYALETSHVRGIEPETEITPVPLAPEWLLGVFNLRGNILPAVDPCPLLNLPRRTPGSKGLLIVFQQEAVSAALRVDEVEEMYEVARTSVESYPSGGEGGRADLILGQVRVRDHLIGVLNLAALVNVLMEA